MQEADGRYQLKFRRGFKALLHHLLRSLKCLGCAVGQFLRRDFLSAAFDALGKALQIRGKICPRPVACLSEHRVQKAAYGPLAVGACHVDDAQVFLRIAQKGQELLHAFQSQPGSEYIERMDFFQCFFVGHNLISPCRVGAYFPSFFATRARRSVTFARFAL